MFCCRIYSITVICRILKERMCAVDVEYVPLPMWIEEALIGEILYRNILLDEVRKKWLDTSPKRVKITT